METKDVAVESQHLHRALPGRTRHGATKSAIGRALVCGRHHQSTVPKKARDVPNARAGLTSSSSASPQGQRRT
eukprot:scaffold7446_cov403-Prasinococcus_capsulatus_cf.AAC.4